MRFKRLFLQCECGRSASRLHGVGLTAQHELVMRWWCPGCKRHIYVVKSLSDCWRDCPPQPRGMAAADPREPGENAADTEFLHSLGACFADEAEM